MLIEEIDSRPAGDHPLVPFLLEAGFVKSAMGIVPSRRLPPSNRPALGTPLAPPRRSVISSPFARRYFDDSTDD
jgi:hypothetical protein